MNSREISKKKSQRIPEGFSNDTPYMYIQIPVDYFQQFLMTTKKELHANSKKFLQKNRFFSKRLRTLVVNTSFIFNDTGLHCVITCRSLARVTELFEIFLEILNKILRTRDFEQIHNGIPAKSVARSYVDCWLIIKQCMISDYWFSGSLFQNFGIFLIRLQANSFQVICPTHQNPF